MKILDKYIAREILQSISVVFLILLGIESFIELIGELQDIGTGKYGALQALIYVPLQLPQDLYQLFPVAALIGALVGLGRLARDSELVVMRASGVSTLQIIGSVIRVALLLLIAVTLLGEWLAPFAQRFADQYKSYKETGSYVGKILPGVWLHQNNEYVHMAQVVSASQAKDITIYRFNGQALSELIQAESANKVAEKNWQLHQVSVTQFFPEKVQLNSLSTLAWRLQANPLLIALEQEDVSKMNAYTLFRASSALKHAGLQANQMEFNFWKRLLQPLATLIMMILAIPVILGPLRETTMAARLLIGIVIGFLFYTLNQFFGPFSMVYQLPPLWAASLPVLFFAIICVGLLFKVR